MELLLAPFIAFIALPPLALVPAAGFFGLRQRLALDAPTTVRWCLTAAVILWVAYALYESAVWFWSQGVVAPIRIDLFLFAPILYVVSGLAVFTWSRRA